MSTIEEILASPMVAAAADLAKSEMQGNDPSHDFAHVMRVVKTSIYILQNEPLFKCVPIDKLAVILVTSDEVGQFKVVEFLKRVGCPESTATLVNDIVENISYHKEISGKTKLFPELAVVQDADRLDAIGAIGIARTFSYGARKGTAMHDPQIAARSSLTSAEYVQTPAHKSTTLNHFDEKLFKLAGLMKTATGQRLAEQRHQYMVAFKEQFLAEYELPVSQ